jgi:hypothetical protein
MLLRAAVVSSFEQLKGNRPMKCPHCLQSFHDKPFEAYLNNPSAQVYELPSDQDGYWSVTWQKCPECKRLIITLVANKDGVVEERLVHPKGVARAPISPNVPEFIARDYREASLVLADSPNASAALSRRCLQQVLRDAAKNKSRDLADQIKEVMPTLPSYLASMVDTVRAMGNFAAHPIKSTHTGEIIDVEPGEAEWLLDTLEIAFDFYYVQPAEAARKRNRIDAKLREAGKPPLK